MKDDHKVHKHRHREEEQVHKKCRRKKAKLRNRSRSRSSESHARFKRRSRSSSEVRSTSRSPEHSRSRHHKRSCSKSPEHRSKRSPEHFRSKRSPDHYRRDKETRVKNEDNRSNGNDVKFEPFDGARPNNSGRRNDAKPRWGKDGDKDEKKPMENKAKPDFGLSGKLAEEVNTYKGVVIKYSEPAEARMPKRRWRLYPFKGDEQLPTLYIHRQSAYLIGRDRIVVDLPIDHPSCSKQHAVLQYRVVPYTRDNGMKGNRIRPYIIDLDSANGTFVNNNKIEARKFVELLEKDVVKFAFSSREYVVLHEHSKDEDEDDNVLVVNE